MCYILCTTRNSVYIASDAQGGKRGGVIPPFGKKNFLVDFCVHFWAVLGFFMSIYGWFFGTWFFADGFLFPIKELRLFTNLGHWIRVLDDAGSYMYIVL
jgi:hypothetical protein